MTLTNEEIQKMITDGGQYLMENLKHYYSLTEEEIFNMPSNEIVNLLRKIKD